MKRDALCDKCTKSILKHKGWLVQEDGEYPTYYRVDKGEKQLLKLGWSVGFFQCDLCDVDVKQKDDCSMRSIFKDVNEYISWESEMITKATSFTDLLATI